MIRQWSSRDSRSLTTDVSVNVMAFREVGQLPDWLRLIIGAFRYTGDDGEGNPT
jgi:hypothetical protein